MPLGEERSNGAIENVHGDDPERQSARFRGPSNVGPALSQDSARDIEEGVKGR
jgi:hypothetical protein